VQYSQPAAVREADSLYSFKRKLKHIYLLYVSMTCSKEMKIICFHKLL